MLTKEQFNYLDKFKDQPLQKRKELLSRMIMTESKLFTEAWKLHREVSLQEKNQDNIKLI